VFHERNQLDKAQEDYSKAVELDPKNPIFYENRAIVYTAKGLLKKAAEDYEAAVKLTTDEPRRASLMEKLSVLQAQVAEQSPHAATPELSESKALPAVESAPKNPPVAAGAGN